MIRLSFLGTRTTRLGGTASSLLCRRATTTASTTTHTPLVLSRQQWKAYLANQAKLKPSQTTAKPKEPEKPWPRYMVWTGYTLAATLIPYTMIWIGLTNAWSRPLVLSPVQGTRMEEVLRNHFGDPDAHQVSYTDVRQGIPIPQNFLGEVPQTVRQHQAQLEQFLQRSTIKVRVRVGEPNSEHFVSETQVELPATTKADRQTVMSKVKAELPSSNQLESTALAIDFPVIQEEQTEELSDNDLEEVVSSEMDPLRVETRVYSLWHYQPQGPPSSAPAPSSNNDSANDITAARLRHEIAGLQEELKHYTVATRPIDDITEELKRKKAELRAIEWRKWKLW